MGDTLSMSSAFGGPLKGMGMRQRIEQTVLSLLPLNSLSCVTFLHPHCHLPGLTAPHPHLASLCPSLSLTIPALLQFLKRSKLLLSSNTSARNVHHTLDLTSTPGRKLNVTASDWPPLTTQSKVSALLSSLSTL